MHEIIKDQGPRTRNECITCFGEKDCVYCSDSLVACLELMYLNSGLDGLGEIGVKVKNGDIESNSHLICFTPSEHVYESFQSVDDNIR